MVFDVNGRSLVFGFQFSFRLSTNINLHMLWVITYAIDELVCLKFTSTDAVDGCEQWESEMEQNSFGIGSIFAVILFIAYFSSIPLLRNIKLTSSAVIGPCNF